MIYLCLINHTNETAHMQRDGEAVLQTLTAVWRGMRHLRKYDKRGNDLEEVERVLGTVRPPSGSSSLWGGGSAGDASRHATVIYCGTASPSCLPMWNGLSVSKESNRVHWADTSVCPYIGIIAPQISRRNNTL